MRSLFVLLFALLAVGCTKRVDPDEIRRGDVPAAEYYPLAVGNAWTYHVNYLGEQRDTTVAITGESAGQFQDNMGNALSHDAWGVRDQKRYLIRDPVTVGEDWTNVVSVSSVERYKIIEAGQSCSVPAGQFPDCVRVEARNRVDAKTTLVNEMTFARGVGIVRIKTVAETSDGQKIPQTQLELTKYELKGQKR
jgi:hypothetical protein